MSLTFTIVLYCIVLLVLLLERWCHNGPSDMHVSIVDSTCKYKYCSFQAHVVKNRPMWDPNPAPSMSWPIALSTELQGELCIPLSVNTRNKKKGGLVFFFGSGATARQGPEFAEGCGPAGHWPQGKAPQSMGVGFIRALLRGAVLSSYASVLTNDAQLHASVCTGVHT